ncbi:hypothetical protein J2752_000894 [Halarchaeum rubridurum]|uniref:Uncharacterized protein n=1 Tax=Halarchaeum rubridurum TaxID=489911 RepID=A0A830FXP3_9EURY|nr:hypothetical protein [Halarchaeum rubridurum]MBP1954013.1 hypothetical protein [Halarchaeum rubridurum]GGM56678.1 hypothetical protein GCM10009017_03520 [Halarchaeum rubridurum]
MGETYSRWTLAALAVVGILGPGMAHYYLNRAGYPLVANVVFVVGYLGAAFLLWNGWLRHVDIGAN